jgi:hypothetical protein
MGQPSPLEASVPTGNAAPVLVASPPALPPRIAVIAVHGVADPEPGDSARAVADLFLRCPGGDWRASESTTLSLPILTLPGDFDAPPVLNTRHVEERSRPIRNALERKERTPDPALTFVEGFFEGYKPELPRTYATPHVRLERSRPDAPPVLVDVVELYWADLSRAGKGLLRFLGEMYQLLLHLPSLGRHAIDAEVLRHPQDRQLRRFHVLQAWSIRLLTLVIVILNLLMLTSAALVASSAVPHDWAVRAAVVAAALAAATAVSFRGLRGRAWRSTLVVLAAASAGAALAWTALRGWGWASVLAVEAWVLIACLVLTLSRSYEHLRPGAFWWTRTGLVVLGTTTAALAAANVEGGNLPLLGLQLVTTLFVVLRVAWFALFLLSTVQFLLGLALARRRKEALGSFWTARSSLAIGTVAFLVANLSLWAAAARSVAPVLPPAYIDPWTFDAPGLPALLPPEVTTGHQLWGDFVKGLVTATSGGTFSGSVALLITLVFALWIGLAREILDELRPPTEGTPEQRDEQYKHTTNGLAFIFGSTNVLSVGLAVAVVTCVLVGLRRLALPDVAPWQVAGLLATAFVARGWLGPARSLLDVFLDIDNYMREHPCGASPRVRMFERVYSLLQHFDTATTSSGARAFDAVVLVAHSQGSVIVADFLRLARPRRWGPSRTPVHLITMGSPLEALYEHAFPALYGWLSKETVRDGELGLGSWTNVYRPGDYIGRRLRPALARDVGIGRGAHTHYWDQHACSVAQELDRVVVGISKSAPSQPLAGPPQA